MKLDLSKYETYAQYIAREGISKQNLNNRIVRKKVKVKFIPSIGKKLIVK